MSCSVRTGSAGSGGSLRKVTTSVSFEYGNGSNPLTNLFPDINVIYAGLEGVTAGSTGSGAPGAPFIEVTETEIKWNVPGGGQYILATVFALY